MPSGRIPVGGARRRTAATNDCGAMPRHCGGSCLSGSSDHETSSRPDPYTVPAGDTSEQPETSSDTQGSSEAQARDHRDSRDLGRPPTDDERKQLRRRGLSLTLLVGLALVSSVFLPPIGLLVGIVAVVQIARFATGARRLGLSPAVRGLQFGGGITAIVIGLVLSIGMVVLWTELTTYQSCQSGAQTRVALDRCQDELMDDLQQRFG